MRTRDALLGLSLSLLVVGCPQQSTVPSQADNAGGATAHSNSSRSASFINTTRQSLLRLWNEPDPEGEVKSIRFGIDDARDQNATPFDQALAGTWELYQLGDSETRPFGILRITSDGAFNYSSYEGKMMYAVPRRYRDDRSTYWHFGGGLLDNFYARSGYNTNGVPILRIYSANKNRMSGFGVPR
ncbi:MAG TPA: hypothetical protein V6D00_11505 [Pantanalinema sp.]